MKHFIPLAALSFAPLVAFANAEADHDHDKKAPAAKTASAECKDGCCDSDATKGHEHGDEHGDDITIAPELVAKFGLTTEKIAPGKIARTTILTGEITKDESLAKAPAVVVLAKVSERAATKFKAGETHLRVAPLGGQSCEALFHSLTPVADSAKGFITARFVVENKDAKLEAGTKSEFRLVTSEKEFPLTIPRAAILNVKGKTFVFVEEKPGVYERHPLTMVDGDDRRVAVKGIEAGEAVATDAAALLKALDSAHGHSHGPDGDEPDHDHDHDHAGHNHDKGHAHDHGANKPADGVSKK